MKQHFHHNIVWKHCTKEAVPESASQYTAPEYHQVPSELHLALCVVVRLDQNQTKKGEGDCIQGKTPDSHYNIWRWIFRANLWLVVQGILGQLMASYSIFYKVPRYFSPIPGYLCQEVQTWP